MNRLELAGDGDRARRLLPTPQSVAAFSLNADSNGSLARESPAVEGKTPHAGPLRHGRIGAAILREK